MPFAKIKFLSRRNSSHCFDKCFAYYWADWNLRPHGNIKIRNTKKVWWWRWMVNRMTFTFGVHLNNDRFALSLFIIAKIGSAITYRRLHRMQVAHAIMSNLPMINRGAQKLICGLGPGSFQISFLQFKEISLFWSFWNARSQSFNETWIEQQSKVAVTSCSTDHALLLETLFSISKAQHEASRIRRLSELTQIRGKSRKKRLNWTQLDCITMQWFLIYLFRQMKQNHVPSNCCSTIELEYQHRVELDTQFNFVTAASLKFSQAMLTVTSWHANRNNAMRRKIPPVNWSCLTASTTR